MSLDTGRPASRDDWLKLVERSLRGRSLAGLLGATRDGIEVRPLYTEGPGPPAAARDAADPRRAERGWDIRQLHRVDAGAGRSAPELLRHDIDDDLAGGATSVELDLGEGITADELDVMLAGVDLAETPVALAPHAQPGTAQALLTVAGRRGQVLAAGGSLGLDPVGEWARSGRVVDCAAAAEWAVEATGAPGPASGTRRSPGVTVFTADGVGYADAGATEAQALGLATAAGVACLRALVAAGLSVDEAAGLIGFRLTATADQFVTVAALRAARVMWARVVTASGGSQQSARQYQHAVTAAHTYSRRDPWVNLLRGAVAALAAGVAGADAVTVLAFDHAADVADSDAALGRRLARNTQLLLLEESHLARMGDPAGGSFYVESLTDELARAAWSILQETEAAGGVAAQAADGSLEAAVAERWEQRLQALSTRREPLTGVSEYPRLEDAAAGLDAAARGLPDGLDADDGAVAAARGLPVRRLAQPFEDLRDAADRHRLVTGERPTVWVAALGPAAIHSSRTAWAQNLLAAGGIEARGGEGVDSPVAAAADFAASGLSVAVITGTDAMYRLRGPATARALSDAGAAFVAVVCDSNTAVECLEALKSAGVGDCWHHGIDVVAALERLHRTLAID